MLIHRLNPIGSINRWSPSDPARSGYGMQRTMAICNLVRNLIGDDFIEVPVACEIAGTAGDHAKLVCDATVRPSRIVNGQIPQGPSEELAGIEVSANLVLFLGEDSHSIRLQVSARADGRVGGDEIAVDK